MDDTFKKKKKLHDQASEVNNFMIKYLSLLYD